MFRDACRTDSFVIDSEFRAFPKAKLMRCSRSSSSVTGLFRVSSRAFFSSGDIWRFEVGVLAGGEAGEHESLPNHSPSTH